MSHLREILLNYGHIGVWRGEGEGREGSEGEWERRFLVLASLDSVYCCRSQRVESDGAHSPYRCTDWPVPFRLNLPCESLLIFVI